MIDGVLPTDNAFVSFALQNPVLQLLTRALGEVPLPDYVLLTLSQESHASALHGHLYSGAQALSCAAGRVFAKRR